MSDYLYILPFKDKKHFKIGISSNSYSRIFHLDKIYNIDLDNSFIVHSKKRNIALLERELLMIFEQDDVDNFLTDGHTEIRNVKYLNECLELIQNKHQNLVYRIDKFKIPENVIGTNKKPKILKRKSEEISTLCLNIFLKDLLTLYEDCVDIKRHVFDEHIVYEFFTSKFSSDNLFSKFGFHFTNHVQKYHESFNVGCSHVVEYVCDDLRKVKMVLPNHIEATEFEYLNVDYEYNDDTKRFLTLFKKTLEQIYFNQEFETEISFDEIVKQVEHETLNDFYTWNEMEDFMKIDETYKEFEKWAKTF